VVLGGFRFPRSFQHRQKKKQANDRSQRGLPKGGLLKSEGELLRYSEGPEQLMMVYLGTERGRDGAVGGAAQLNSAHAR
jgi:hypothetical protein